MKLEKQVCRLELAKKLKELGVNQESLFRYINIPKGITSKSGYVPGWRLVYLGKNKSPEMEVIPAFTVAELGEMLPPMYYSMRLPGDYGVAEMNGKWCCLKGGKIENKDLLKNFRKLKFVTVTAKIEITGPAV